MTGKNILIVEDDGIIAFSLQRTLKRFGYEILGPVTCGKEALQTIAAHPADLVLMDIHLPGELNGIEAAAQIRARHNVPVVYLTAYSEDALLQQAKITEPYGYLVKPVQDRELRATIEMALYRHELETRLKESERWLDTTLKSIGDAVIATDAQGRVTFMNPVAQDLTGWREAEALGRNLSEVFHTIDETTGERIKSLLDRVLKEGVTVGLTNHTQLVRKDGLQVPVDDNVAPIQDHNGKIIGTVLVFRDITERVRAERVLRQREELYSSLFENNHAVMLLIDPETARIVAANPAACDFYGYSEEALKRKKVVDINTLTETQIFAEMRAARAEQRQHFRFRHRLADGTVRDVEVYSGPVKVEDRELLYSIVHDVTERVRAEEALRESEERFRTIFETARDSIFIKDRQLRYAHVNPAMEKLFGCPASELVGKRDGELFGAQAGAHLRRVDERVLRGETIEEENTKPVNGAPTTFHVIKTPMYESGEIVGVCGIARDITARVKAEAELDRRLQEAVLLNRVIAEASSALTPDVVIETVCHELVQTLRVSRVIFASLDDNQQQLTVTTECCQEGQPAMLGTLIPVVDNSLTRQVLGEREPVAVSNVRQDPQMAGVHEGLLGQGALSLLLVPLLVRERVVGILGLYSSEPREFRGRVVRLVQSVVAAASQVFERARLYEALEQELVERRLAEETLREYANELEARNEELDAYAQTVAHDLKNPLGLVVGLAETLGQECATMSDDEIQERLRVIARNGRKMGDIVDALLLLAETRKEVELEPLEMSDIVNSAQRNLSYMIDRYQAKLVVPDAWPVALGHALWVEEVWVNYLSNAIKYGGRPPHIELGATVQDGDMIRFWVRDNGLGIPPEDRERVFKPFERLPGGRIDGYGLGLSIVRRIVEKLGGWVGVDSDGEAGQGSTFYFTLPSVAGTDTISR